MSGAEISQDGSTLTVRVPLTFRKRGGHKLVIAPNGSDSWAPPRPRVDNAMVKAIARAFRWRKLLETGTHTSVAEIAAAEKINASYVGRVLRLTLLSPEIVEAILDGRQPADLQLEDLLRPFPVGWREQRAEIWGPNPDKVSGPGCAVFRNSFGKSHAGGPGAAGRQRQGDFSRLPPSDPQTVATSAKMAKSGPELHGRIT
jgi:hypothetical protein